MRYVVLSGFLIPLLQTSASQASDLVETAVIEGAIGMEAEALDVGAVLLGDVALLIMAPLVIYAALKMIWEEQFEEANKDVQSEEMADGSDPLSKKTSFAASSELESHLTDPVLKNVATTAAKNIVNAAKEASESCQFDAELDELAVKHGGRQQSLKWIEQMLKKQNADGDGDDIRQEVLEHAEGLSADDLCLLISKLKAEKAAIHEIRKVIEVLIKRHQS